MAYIKIEIPTVYKTYNDLNEIELNDWLREKQADIKEFKENLLDDNISKENQRIRDIVSLYKFLDNKEGI